MTALWSHVYARPTARAPVLAELPFLAEVAVAGSTGGFYRLRDGGFVARPHLAPVAGDVVAQAERFLGVPYLWGGRSIRGIDCSGLVQLAVIAGGRTARRDSDMQAALLGAPLPPDAVPERGDLVFWQGHVGIMQDAGDAAPRQRPPDGGRHRAAGRRRRPHRPCRRRPDHRPASPL